MKGWVMQNMAFIMHEQDLNINGIDKIFSSLWISNDELLFTSKCFKIKRLKLKRSDRFEINDFWGSESYHDFNRNTINNWKRGTGIHAIASSPNPQWGDLVIWGAANDLHFKNLKTNQDWYVKAHADTIYSLIVLTPNIIVSGSRDGSLCLTSIIQRKSSCIDLRKGSIRGLSKLGGVGIVGALNSFSGYLDSWDFQSGSRVCSWDLPKKEELACIESFSNYFVVGSQNHITFIDHRCPKASFSAESTDNGAGVRSLLYKNEYLLMGSGSGKITFFDIRARQYLHTSLNDISRVHSLDAGPGWLGSNPFELSHIENAIYTLGFNDDRNLLFTGGGPIRANVQGSYAGLWRI